MSEPEARFAVPIILTVAGGVVVVAFFTIWHWASEGNAPRIVGTSIGIGMGVALGVGLYLLWLRWARPLRRAVGTLTESTGDGIVIGGRIPRLSGEEVARSWPAELGPPLAPQSVVVSVSERGMTLHDVRVPPQLLLEVRWVDVSEVIPAEYVEKDRAYESLAIVGPTPATAILVQPVSVDRRAWVGIPSGEKLRHLAALVEGFRR